MLNGNWLLFALGAPVLWSLTNVLDAAVRRHFVKSDLTLMWLLAFFRLIYVVILLPFIDLKIPDLITTLWMLLGGVLWVSPFALYFKAIEKEEPSRLALLLQLVPIFTFIVAFFTIGETLTFNQAIAFVFLIIGGVVAAIKKVDNVWRFSSAIGLIVVAAFMWAVGDVIFKKFEPDFAHFWSAFAAYFLGSGLVSVGMLFSKKSRQAILKPLKGLSTRAWVILISSDTCGVVGTLSFAYALSLGKASLTTVMLAIQPLLVIAFGIMLRPLIKEIPKEDLSRSQLILKSISFGFIVIGILFLEFIKF